jgi:hypothetical protein
MLFHLPIMDLASLQPVPGADTVPKFDVSRVCQSEGGSNEEEKRCVADETKRATPFKGNGHNLLPAQKSSATRKPTSTAAPAMSNC